MAMDETSLVALLEAIYALELDDQRWLTQVLSATAALCGAEHSYLGYFYDASGTDTLNVWNVCGIALSPEVEESFRIWEKTVSPALVRATFRSLQVGSTRQTGMPSAAPVLAYRESVGWGDIFNVNGLDPSGIGCVLTIGTRARDFLASAQEMSVYRRIAHHLAAAFRCRRRLASLRTSGSSSEEADRRGPEAIMDPQGRFVLAEGEAAAKASRELIGGAARRMNALRTEGRKSGAVALDAWRPLVGARWTLVDSFEEDGRRYIVARENQARAAGVGVLTDREREVVLQAALGFTNKEIAYALGISDSTVRVLMSRAMAKLGVRSRVELLSHPSLREIRADRAGT